MTLGDLRKKWQRLDLVTDTQSLPLHVFLECCLGEHKSGLLFQGKGEEKDKVFVLKCDEHDNLYKRKGNIDDTEEEWISMGVLLENRSTFF